MTTRNQGFTLIELVVAITILGLALAAVMPDVSAWLRNQRIRNMAAVIAHDRRQHDA